MHQMDRIHPKLVPYVLALTSHEFGLQGAFAEVENIECGSIVTKKGKRWGDRFNIRILYCTRRLTWKVLMRPYNLMEPPDFILEDNFLDDADHALIQSQVQSLAHWQPSDPKCLLKVVLELLELYKQFQSDFLTMNRESRLCLEYYLLMNYLNTSLSDLEIYVHNTARVSFLLHLNVDFSKLPIPLPKQKHLALLFVELGGNAKNVVSLLKPGELDEVFSKVNLHELRCNVTLVEYIRRVEDYVQSIVDDIVQKLNMRKMLYCYLMQALEPALLNGDNITFHSISFLLEVNNQYFVLKIEIPSMFPSEQPEISISCMKRLNIGTKFFVSLKNFKYNSEWEVQKIFKNIYNFIKNEAIPQYNKIASDQEGRAKSQQ